MALTRLNLPPDQTGYSVTDGNEVLSAKLDGGASRFRRDILGSTSNVTVQWSVGPQEYKYLRSFYKAFLSSGSKPFSIELIVDEADLTEHKAYFVPGSMRLQSQSGLQYVVAAQLEIYPLELDIEQETNFVILFSEFGKNWESVFPIFEDDFNTIINFSLPDYLQ